MKISSGVDTQELLAVLGKGGYLSVGGAPLKEILTRLEQAEQAVARVRELALESQAEVAQLNMPNIRTLSGEILRALDGHTKQLGGTPTGEFADVCSCGKSYWPCTALDGDGRG